MLPEASTGLEPQARLHITALSSSSLSFRKPQLKLTTDNKKSRDYSRAVPVVLFLLPHRAVPVARTRRSQARHGGGVVLYEPASGFGCFSGRWVARRQACLDSGYPSPGYVRQMGYRRLLHIPHGLYLHSEVIMEQNVTHIRDFPLLNLRVLFPELLGKPLDRLPYYAQVPDDGILYHSVLCKGLESAVLSVPSYPANRLQDIL